MKFADIKSTMKKLDMFKRAIFMIIGALTSASGLNLFLIPRKIAPGGITGISTIIHYVTGIDVGLLIIVLNLPIFFVGYKAYGKRFMLASLAGTALLSLFTSVLSFLPEVTHDRLLSSVFGGALLGAGLGIVFMQGATTGGTDVLAKVTQKKFPHVSVGNFILALDTVVITLAAITFREWEVMLYSAVALFISSKVIDGLLEGLNFAKTLFIISEKPQDISDFVLNNLHRGVTGLNGVSMYTKLAKTVLMCVIKKHEVPKVKASIRKVDPKAFVIVADVKEVLGKGFSDELI